jgi:aerobic carbon-monoxide dehydrogenase medium subunit
VKPASFVYHRPTTLDEAGDMLASTHGKVLAGGQSLIPIMSMRLASPADLVDINPVTGLDGIEVTESAVRVGCLVRHRALELDGAAYAANPLLRRATACVAHPTIRNRGTTVGSLVHADPAAEMPGVLALLGGSVEAYSRSAGTRTVAAEDFFVGPLECCLRDDEIAVAATFPRPEPRTGSAWVELARRHGDYALVGVGALVTVDADRHVVAARVALISVSAAPVVVDLAAVAAGAAHDAVDWTGADQVLDSALDPEADIHATAQYRAQLSRVLTRRALSAATADAARRAAA